MIGCLHEVAGIMVSATIKKILWGLLKASNHGVTLPCRPAMPRRRLVVLCFALGMMLFIIEQYIEPIVENSIGPLRTMVRARSHKS